MFSFFFGIRLSVTFQMTVITVPEHVKSLPIMDDCVQSFIKSVIKINDGFHS